MFFHQIKVDVGIDVEKFNSIIKLLHRHLPSVNKSKISYKDQLLMTLVKLRLNQQWDNLADIFRSSRPSLNEIFWKWINLIHAKLSFLIKWPDHDASRRTLCCIFGLFVVLHMWRKPRERKTACELDVCANTLTIDTDNNNNKKV